MLSITGLVNYRNQNSTAGYQGDYAEKEAIGSTNSFELRLYDARIGRWMTTDPYGEFHSPYLAMGNNPVSITDPDGGCTNKSGRECEFSVLDGQATDFQGNTWTKDFATGNLDMITQIQLDEVLIREPIVFKSGQTYNIEVINRVYFDLAIFDYSKLKLSHKSKDISTSGFSIGGSAGPGDAGIFTKYHSKKITFHADVQGRDLLDVFDDTGLINMDGFGATIHYVRLRGYDSPQTMNLIWEAHLKGHGLSAGFHGSRSVPNFKKSNNQ